MSTSLTNKNQLVPPKRLNPRRSRKSSMPHVHPLQRNYQRKKIWYWKLNCLELSFVMQETSSLSSNVLQSLKSIVTAPAVGVVFACMFAVISAILWELPRSRRAITNRYTNTNQWGRSHVQLRAMDRHWQDVPVRMDAAIYDKTRHEILNRLPRKQYTWI